MGDERGNLHRNGQGEMGEPNGATKDSKCKDKEGFNEAYDCYEATSSFSNFYQWGHDSSVEDRFGSLLCPLYKLRKWQRIHQAIHLDMED